MTNENTAAGSEVPNLFTREAVTHVRSVQDTFTVLLVIGGQRIEMDAISALKLSQLLDKAVDVCCAEQCAGCGKDIYPTKRYFDGLSDKRNGTFSCRTCWKASSTS